MSDNKEIFNKHHQRLFDVLLHNKQKYVDLVVNNKTNKYGGKNKEDVERAIDEIIDSGYLNKPVNYGENIQDDIVITASICNYIENHMIDKINIVKRACKELGLTYKQLGEAIGYGEGAIKNSASTGNVSEPMAHAIKMYKRILELEHEVADSEAVKENLKRWLK